MWAVEYNRDKQDVLHRAFPDLKKIHKDAAKTRVRERTGRLANAPITVASGGRRQSKGLAGCGHPELWLRAQVGVDDEQRSTAAQQPQLLHRQDPRSSLRPAFKPCLRPDSAQCPRFADHPGAPGSSKNRGGRERGRAPPQWPRHSGQDHRRLPEHGIHV